jgi:hypothetical protein
MKSFEKVIIPDRIDLDIDSAPTTTGLLAKLVFSLQHSFRLFWK